MRLLTAILMLAATACGAEGDTTPVPEQVTGIITAIGRGDDGAIESFTLRAGRRTFDIRLDPRRGYGFDLRHLEDHRAANWPVRVRLEQRDGEVYAVEILDASRPGGVPE